jgi:hypothetical protein
MRSSRSLLGEQALSKETPVTHIVPYPYSSNIEFGASGELEPRLSIMSLMAIDSAVMAWEEHLEANIVLIGETCYGDTLPSTNDLMIARAHDVSGQIDDSAIVRLDRLTNGRALNNTYLQTEALSVYLNKANVSTPAQVLAVPLNYHCERVMHTAEAYGLGISFVIAEDILHQLGVTDYDRYLPYIQGLESSERILRFVNHIDRKGRLFNLMTGISGARIVDVVEGDDGKRLALEQDLAEKKMSALYASVARAKKSYT